MTYSGYAMAHRSVTHNPVPWQGQTHYQQQPLPVPGALGASQQPGYAQTLPQPRPPPPRPPPSRPLPPPWPAPPQQLPQTQLPPPRLQSSQPQLHLQSAPAGVLHSQARHLPTAAARPPPWVKRVGPAPAPPLPAANSSQPAAKPFRPSGGQQAAAEALPEQPACSLPTYSLSMPPMQPAAPPPPDNLPADAKHPMPAGSSAGAGESAANGSGSGTPPLTGLRISPARKAPGKPAWRQVKPEVAAAFGHAPAALAAVAPRSGGVGTTPLPAKQLEAAPSVPTHVRCFCYTSSCSCSCMLRGSKAAPDPAVLHVSIRCTRIVVASMSGCHELAMTTIRIGKGFSAAVQASEPLDLYQHTATTANLFDSLQKSSMPPSSRGAERHSQAKRGSHQHGRRQRSRSRSRSRSSGRSRSRSRHRHRSRHRSRSRQRWHSSSVSKKRRSHRSSSRSRSSHLPEAHSEQRRCHDSKGRRPQSTSLHWGQRRPRSRHTRRVRPSAAVVRALQHAISNAIAAAPVLSASRQQERSASPAVRLQTTLQSQQGGDASVGLPASTAAPSADPVLPSPAITSDLQQGQKTQKVSQRIECSAVMMCVELCRHLCPITSAI